MHAKAIFSDGFAVEVELRALVFAGANVRGDGDAVRNGADGAIDQVRVVSLEFGLHKDFTRPLVLQKERLQMERIAHAAAGFDAFALHAGLERAGANAIAAIPVFIEQRRNALGVSAGSFSFLIRHVLRNNDFNARASDVRRAVKVQADPAAGLQFRWQTGAATHEHGATVFRRGRSRRWDWDTRHGWHRRRQRHSLRRDQLDPLELRLRLNKNRVRLHVVAVRQRAGGGLTEGVAEFQHLLISPRVE